MTLYIEVPVVLFSFPILFILSLLLKFPYDYKLVLVSFGLFLILLF